jgi:hypothetical protein
MGEDVEFEEDMESKSISELQRVLVKWIQGKTPIGLVATNGALVLPTPFTLLRLTADLLKKAVTAGINPKLNVDPRSIGFGPEDVDRYGYYALFVTNLPFYMQKIWGP